MNNAHEVNELLAALEANAANNGGRYPSQRINLAVKRVRAAIAALQANSGGVGELVERIIETINDHNLAQHGRNFFPESPQPALVLREEIAKLIVGIFQSPCPHGHRGIRCDDCYAALAKACPPNRESE